ncbi:MAG: late competence development ComFB family protein [Coleofasciculaceae cyanobacterium]
MMTLVNLTLLKVTEEIENFLASYPDLVDRTTLKDQNFRPQLVAYVLSRIPNRYVAIEAKNESSISTSLSIYSTQEQLVIEKRIYQGIFALNKKEYDQELYSVRIRLDHSYYRID